MRKHNIVRAKSRTRRASLGRRVFFCALFTLFLFLFPAPYTLNSAFAQYSGTCTTTGTTIATGLVTSPSLDQNLVTSSGACVVNDPKAAFAPQKVPTYDDLESLYYTQAKSSATVNKVTPLGDNPDFGQFNSQIQSSSLDSIFLVNGNLTISNTSFPSNGNKTVVILVKGDTKINTNITYAPPASAGSSNYGLVLVVKGNVNIDKDVTTVNAVIISEGIICTAFDGSSCPSSNVQTSQLIINGSLISLTDSRNIQFRRNLDPAAAINNSNNPAEKINHQVKYLVLLRNLFSDTFQRWSETQ